MLLVCFISTFAGGCIKFSFTPVVSTVQLVPSDIIKSRFIGESCGSGNVFGGGGNLSLGDFLKENRITKVTYVDYDIKASMFGGSVCMKVYGY